MDATNPVLNPQPLYRQQHSSELGSQSEESVAVISSENHIDREDTQHPESSKPPEGVLDAHDIVTAREVVSTPGLSLKRSHDKSSDSPLPGRDKSLPPAKRSRQLDGNDLKARLEALVSERQRLATPIDGLPGVGSEYGAQQSTDGSIGDEVALVRVNEAGGYDSNNSAGSSGFTEKSGYMNGSRDTESAGSNSDPDFSELEGV